MSDLRVGDRVELIHTTGCALGTVVDVVRSGKVCVRFDDLSDATWVLKPGSLKRTDRGDR